LISFAAGILEGAAYTDPNAMVVGISGVGIWMMLCARLMPKAPLKSAITAGLCIVMWPLGYWFDVRIFGYQPMSAGRLMAWVLPLVIIGIWVYVLNNRTLAFYFQQERAEEIGSYTLTSLIGKGGMGEVWRAKHRSLAREAAVKLIRPEMLHSSTVHEERMLKWRFEREAQATAALRSPHTVALYDYGEAKGGAYYYVMELIQGIDLETLVDRFGPMDPGRVAYILEQMAESLEEAHQMGLVHRDIKPRNIIIGKLGLRYDFVKVLDFGLVKTLHARDADRTATMGGDMAGTPAYVSPEAALGSPKVDGRADLYSLGCTAYFLLTARTVFLASSPTGYAIAHVSTPPAPMSSWFESPPPPELEAIVMHLLEKDPAKRIQSARELSVRLRRLTSVRQWSQEDAERWWEINSPDLGVARQENSDTASTIDGLSRSGERRYACI
jgi:serine/threonine-protein kinase